jgi:rhodanese-related sulfurtransferase
VLIIVLVALFLFWGSEHLERVFGGKDMSQEPKLRKIGAAALFAAALGVLVIGSPSMDDRYQRLSFKRTEVIKEADGKPKLVDGKPQTVNHVYSADEMLAKRLVFTSPAETFKAKYQQAIKPIYLDVRSESDYNLYHVADSINVPLERIAEVVPSLLTEPPANTVFITIGNGEAAATAAWKQLVASSVQNVYILEGGINNWISVFGAKDTALQPLANAGADQLGYQFTAALGSGYKSCAPSPIEYEKLDFQTRIVLQLRRDKSGGGCG